MNRAVAENHRETSVSISGVPSPQAMGCSRDTTPACCRRSATSRAVSPSPFKRDGSARGQRDEKHISIHEHIAKHYVRTGKCDSSAHKRLVESGGFEAETYQPCIGAAFQ